MYSYCLIYSSLLGSLFDLCWVHDVQGISFASYKNLNISAIWWDIDLVRTLFFLVWKLLLNKVKIKIEDFLSDCLFNGIILTAALACYKRAAGRVRYLAKLRSYTWPSSNSYHHLSFDDLTNFYVLYTCDILQLKLAQAQNNKLLSFHALSLEIVHTNGNSGQELLPEFSNVGWSTFLPFVCTLIDVQKTVQRVKNNSHAIWL